MNTFFTADLHFCHGNILKYCRRPWLRDGDLIGGQWVSDDVKFARTKEMDEAMIANWNAVVGSKDVVYVLGDFAFCKSSVEVEGYVRRLNGHIYLVRGNHDKKPVTSARGFAWVGGKEQGLMAVVKGQEMFLSHYACRVWNQSHHGSWHLYGHSHHTLPDDPCSLSLDVGVDGWDFTPVSFDQIREKMSQKTWKPINRHS